MSIPPVVVEFQLRGVPEVMQAFRSIGDRMIDSEQRATTASTRGSAARISAAERESALRDKAFAKVAKEADRWAREETRTREREAREQTRSAEREAKEQTRTEQQEARERVRAEEQAAKDKERAFARTARTAERWQREETANAVRNARERADLANRFVRTAGHGLGAAGHDILRVTRGVAGLATTSMGGNFDLATAVQKASQETGIAADISQSGFLPNQGGANAQRRSTSEILGVARGAAISQGLDSTQALGGLQKFVGISGDLDRGMKLLPQMAELARATGSSLDDIAEAAGNVSLNLRDTDKDGSKTMTVMRGLASQGKLGAVEMRDLAGQISKLSAASGQFSGDMAENMLKMGALAQEARGEGGAFSASVAANSIQGFATTLKTGARINAFKGVGIDVFSDKTHTQFRAPEELIVDALKKTGGDREKMNALFKNIMGARAVEGFAQRFTAAGGGEKGEQAVRARFQELFKGNLMTKQDVATAAAQRNEEADAKMARITAEFDRAVAEQLVPELTKLIPTVREMIPLFVEVAHDGIPAFVELIRTVSEFVNGHKAWIHSMAEHPIGAIIGFELTKSFAAAALPALLQKLFAAAFSGGGGGAVGNAVAAGGKVPTALAATAAIAGVGAGIATTMDASSAAEGESKDARTTVTTLFGMAKELRSGNVTPERRQQIEAYQRQVRAHATDISKVDTSFGASLDAGVLSGFEKLGNFAGITDSKRFQQSAQTKVQAQIYEQNAAAIQTALLQLDKAKAGAPGGSTGTTGVKVETKLDDHATRAMRDFAAALDRNHPQAGSPASASHADPSHPARTHGM